MDWLTILMVIFWIFKGVAAYGFSKGAHVTSYEIDGWRYTRSEEFTCWFFAFLGPVGFMVVLIGELLKPHRPRWRFVLRVQKHLRSEDRPVWRSQWYGVDPKSEDQRAADGNRRRLGKQYRENDTNQDGRLF